MLNDRGKRRIFQAAIVSVHDLRPYSTITSDCFRNLLHALEQRYTPPNRDTISEQIIPTIEILCCAGYICSLRGGLVQRNALEERACLDPEHVNALIFLK